MLLKFIFIFVIAITTTYEETWFEIFKLIDPAKIFLLTFIEKKKTKNKHKYLNIVN